jgi:hypothetical protein
MATKQDKIAEAIQTASDTAKNGSGMSFGDVPMVDINPKSIEAKRVKTGGRRKKENEDKASESVTIKITPLQLEELTNKAGLIPLSAYIKNILKESGTIN